MMLAYAFALSTLAADDPPPKHEQLLQEINLAEARHWEMWLDPERTKKAELIEKPVSVWTNPTTTYGVQHGSVFVWAHEGRPMVIGSIFAHPVGKGKRKLIHEFHSLAPAALSAVSSDEQNSVWEPAGGLKLEPLAESPRPDAAAGKRLLQMRTIGREFGGHTVDWRKQRWELRLQPQPLYRYDQPQAGVLDGALFSLVSNAGTDPEVFLLLEARADGWHFALLRFADSNLYVTRKEKEIWTAVRGPDHAQLHNAEHTYQVFHKPLIDDPVEAVAEETP